MDEESRVVMYNAINDSIWNVLPPGSHLVLHGKGSERGATVVAFQYQVGHPGGMYALTDRGAKVEITEDRTLSIGKVDE